MTQSSLMVGGLGGDRGYRRSIGREEGELDVADVEANVLGYGVMLVDLDGLSDTSRVPHSVMYGLQDSR